MKLIAILWKNFKVQPEIWFFYGFLLTFTLTVRKVLWFFPLRGEFNEYSGIYLYLSDIFLVLTLAAWIITILYNKYSILSMFKTSLLQGEGSASEKMFHARPVAKKCSIPVGMFHVEHPTGQAWNFLYSKRKTIIHILLPLALVVWSFISLIWAENKFVAIFRSVKILEFYLLYIFVIVRLVYWNINNNVPRGTLLKKMFRLIMVIGLIQAIIGIIQFLFQHSIGLFWLKESLILPNMAGVAKVIFNNKPFIRAYGLFPHPNILGGFLLFSIFISRLYYKMFHARLDSRSLIDPPRLGEAGARRMEQLIKISLGIQFLGLILTFSKSAILGLILGLIYYIYINVPLQKECSTWNILRGKRGTWLEFIKKKKRLIITAGLIIIFTFVIVKPDFYSLLLKGLDERLVYINVSRGTIWDNPILGIGNGQFVINMKNLPVIKENWMLQPVHNIFLLIWSELGIIGLGILVWFIIYIFRTSWFGTTENVKNTFSAIFIGLLFIMFFDHYLWDIQQGSFLLWMTMGFLVGAGERDDTI